jgi:hypothetical protein
MSGEKSVYGIKKLVEEWVREKAEEAKTKHQWIDIEQKKIDSLSKNEHMRYEKNDTYVPKQLDIMLDNSPKPKGAPKETHSGVTHEVNLTTTPIERTGGIETTTTRRYTHKTIYGLDAGLDLSFDGVGIKFGANLSQENEKGLEGTKKINEERKFTVPPGASYTITKKEEVSVYEDNFTATLELTGNIPVRFQDPVSQESKGKFKKGGNEAHHLQFIPVKDILDDLHTNKKLPANITYNSNNDKAICIIKGVYEYQDTKTTIISEEKVLGKSPHTHKKPQEPVHSSQTTPQMSKHKQKEKTNLTVDIGNNSTFEKKFKHDDLDQGLIDITTPIWTKDDKDIVDKAIQKVGDIKTEAFNGSTFKDTVEMGKIRNIAVKIDRRNENATSQTSLAQTISKTGFHASPRLTMEDRNLITRTEELLEELDKPLYLKNFTINECCEEIKTIIDAHKQNKNPFTDSEKETLSNSEKAIQGEKLKIDNKYSSTLTT